MEICRLEHVLTSNNSENNPEHCKVGAKTATFWTIAAQHIAMPCTLAFWTIVVWAKIVPVKDPPRSLNVKLNGDEVFLSMKRIWTSVGTAG